MNLQIADKVIAGIFTCLGIYVVAASWEYGMMRGRVPGPGFFPLISGLLFLIPSAIVLFRRTKQIRARVPAQIILMIAGIVASLVGFIFLAPYIGFTFCAFFLMTTVGWFCEEPEKRSKPFAIRLAVISALACLTCHLFFTYLIMLNLPSGFLGF